MPHIRNPVEWITDEFGDATRYVRTTSHSLQGTKSAPAIRRIAVSDLWDVLRKGFEDFGACRTDVVFLCLIYPIAGFFLARFAFDAELLPLLFPLASGFALIGPVAAVGLYEMSREREQGKEVNWFTAFGMIRAPSFGAIISLSLLLLVIFAVWMGVAYAIYHFTLGPEQPASIGAFVDDVFTTGAGWAMIVIGVGVGFVFAVVVLAISVVSFPLLLDHDVGLGTAISTSVRAVQANPAPLAAWGLVVAGGLVLGSIPVFLGLIVVMPILGHSTWHLYRRLVQTTSP
jgi:uncharacterized membrane protein